MAISPLGNQIRLTGLTSGLDTDQIITDLMRTQRMKYDRMYQSKTQAEWKRDAYTDVNNALRKFRDEYASFLSSNNLLSAGTYKNYQVDLASNPSLSVTTTANAREGVFSVEVLQLAHGDRLTSAAAVAGGDGFSAAAVANTAVESLSFQNGQAVSGDIAFTIGGRDFSFRSTDSLKTIMDTVNASDAGVTMRYSQITDTFTLEATGSGALAAADTTGGFLAAVGLDGGVNPVHDPAQKAQIKINGVSLERDSNEFELDGISLKLTGVTDSALTFGVKRDVQGTVDKIKDFVEAYNTLMDTLYGKLTEKKNYGYKPLTTEQRAELSESEAALWDEKAKSGLLHSDQSLRSLTDNLRTAFTSAVGDMGGLAAIGLSGSSYRYQQASHIEIDEEKLRAALEADADKVYQLFAARVESGGQIDTAKSGFVVRAVDAVDRFTSETTEVSLKSLASTITDWDNKMTAENTRLYNLQESYYKKFAAMETALAQLQSQTDALSSFFTSTE
ncbi:MAG: flagellar filament capping protein FliD [Oscillospiraceae bacterium]|jgi:flagellar hook-associated protein 2|nr:flagellar filament capping protein FliD [Oscillospiraceae bacterium]